MADTADGEDEFEAVDQRLSESQKFSLYKDHREHTILLSRERVNRVNKGTNNSPVVISYILREFTGKAAAYKSCVTL